MAMKPIEATKKTKSLPDNLPAGDDTPMGLGKMTLAQVVEKYNLDQSTTIQKLAKNGILATSDEKMKKIAEKHETTPYDLFEILK